VLDVTRREHLRIASRNSRESGLRATFSSSSPSKHRQTQREQRGFRSEWYNVFAQNGDHALEEVSVTLLQPYFYLHFIEFLLLHRVNLPNRHFLLDSCSSLQVVHLLLICFLAEMLLTCESQFCESITKELS
jgi:hypothetical protein